MAHRVSRLLIVAALSTAFIGAVAVPASATAARERKLERQLSSLRDKLSSVRTQRDHATRQLADANARIGQLSAGLPDAIKAVPVADFYRLVFAPAREAWPCDDLFQSEGFWQVSFQNRC